MQLDCLEGEDNPAFLLGRSHLWLWRKTRLGFSGRVAGGNDRFAWVIGSLVNHVSRFVKVKVTVLGGISPRLKAVASNCMWMLSE